MKGHNRQHNQVPIPEEPPEEIPASARLAKREERKRELERQRKRAANREKETFKRMLARLNITEWDLVLIGDGSGSNWRDRCGWGCVSIDRETMSRKVWWGAMSQGTVNFAEMMAYMQPLSCFAAQRKAERKIPGKSRKLMQIHIITDSEYCESMGSSGRQSPKSNGVHWRVFEDFQRQGMLLNWHWINREDVGLNIYADFLSKAARQVAIANELQALLEAVEPHKTVYNYNPRKKRDQSQDSTG